MYDGETITRPVIYTDSIALKWYGNGIYCMDNHPYGLWKDSR